MNAIRTMVWVTIAQFASGLPLLGAEKRNLLEDGASFEVGVDGFSLNNYYLLSHHGREIVPVLDDTTAVHGKYSLRLDNPLGDKIVLAFRPIRLPKNSEVTVSGYLKGQGKVKVQLMHWPFATVAGTDMDLSQQWERFSFAGAIKSDQNYFLWILPTVDTSRVWLDALQIEEGPLGDFRPKAVELAAATTAPYNTYHVGEDCSVVARLFASEPAGSVPVAVSVLDLMRRQVCRKTLDVPTGGRQHVSATIPLFRGQQRGSYKVIVEAGAGASVEKEVFTFAVLKPVDKADPFFGFNLKQVFNEDAERRYSDNNQEMELVYANAPLEYTLGLMRRVGAASLRCFRIAEYARIEKPSGEFVWRDGYVDLQRQAGLEAPLVVLSATGPKWDADPALAAERGGRGGYLPTMDKWRAYVRAMVGHYKGKVRYYEVVNEPETVFKDVEAYVERLKAAHDVIRQVDPDARIVAPSYSGGRPFQWIDEFCKAGGHRWADIWAIHYAGRTLPERGMDRTTPTWEIIRRYRQTLVTANGGVDKPFWNTEGASFYWSPEYDHWPQPAEQGYEDIGAEHYRVPNESLAAAYAARLLLIEKASGLDREYAFEFGFYYSQNASKAADIWSMYVNYDGSPSPALVAYNAVAEIFAGAAPVDLLVLPQNVLLAVFQREGKSVAAIWKGAPLAEYPGFEQYDGPVLVDVGLDAAALSVTDLLGGPVEVEARGGGLRLSATAYPLYVTSNLPPAQLSEAFRAARLVEGPRPKIDAAPGELIQSHQYRAAIAVLEERLAAGAKDVKPLEMLGACYAELKEFDQATQYFEKALQLDPDSAPANVGIARCYQDNNQSSLPWSQRMAKAAELMGRGIKGVVDRVRQDRKGSYSDLADIYLYFYYLQGSTHVAGNAERALELIDLARCLDPAAANFRTQRMLAARAQLESRVQAAARKGEKGK